MSGFCVKFMYVHAFFLISTVLFIVHKKLNVMTNEKEGRLWLWARTVVIAILLSSKLPAILKNGCLFLFVMHQCIGAVKHHAPMCCRQKKSAKSLKLCRREMFLRILVQTMVKMAKSVNHMNRMAQHFRSTNNVP